MPDDNLTLPHQPDSTVPTGEPHSAIGRFVLGEEIARGGMGAIHRATDTALQREVAVKVLQDRFPPDSPLARRFIEEAQITGQLQHPGIPPVYDLGTLPDGRPFLAMKLIEGKTLAELLANRAASAAGSNDDNAAPRDTRSLTRPGSPDLLPIFESICQAVGYAHTHGIIHRDLKPANVMVGAFGEVQVMDWGLAKQLASRAASAAGSSDTRSLTRHGSPERYNSPDDDPNRTTNHTADLSTDERTRSGQALGTPAFMPPEQARGEVDRVDCRSDVFGLGAILCNVLTGEPPFRARRSADALEKAQRADLADAFARLDSCGADAEVIALCKRCLSAEPAQRPANGGEVAALVAQYRAGVEERLRTAERNRAAAEAKAIEQRKKRRVQLALAGAVFVIAVGGAALGMWQARTEAQRAAAVAQARNRVPELIDLAAELRREYKFKQAEQTLNQAAELAATGGLDDLQPTVAQAQADLAFAVELDAIRMKRSTWIAEISGKGHFDKAGAPEAYRQAFLKRGLDVLASPESVGEYVKVSAVRTELLVALDDWAVLKLNEPGDRDRVLAAARRGEPDPALNAYRDPALWSNPEWLRSLAVNPEVRGLSPGLMVALADVMTERDVNPAPMLWHALSRYPREFLIAFSLGLLLFKQNEISPEAAGACLAARALRPDNVSVINNLGLFLEYTGDLPGAIAAYQEAIRLNPTFVNAHYNLGIALFKSGDLMGAKIAFKEATRLDPKDPHAHSNLGVALFESGDLPGAIASHKEAIRLDPQYARAHTNLGNALRATGDLRGAAASHREAIRLDPNLAEAHSNLGNVLSENDDLDGAITAYKEAIRLDPRLALAHCNLGSALAQVGDLPGAIASCQEAIRLDPGLALAHSNLGAALSASGDQPGAIAACRKAIQLNPKNAGAFSNLGLALRRNHDLPGAITAFKEAIRLDPNNATAYSNLGLALYASGDLPGAIAAFKDAIRIKPNNAKTHYYLSIVYRASDDLPGAIACLQETIRLDPKNALAQFSLGNIYLTNGNLPAAIACLREAIIVDPNYAEAHNNLGVALVKNGDLDGAINCFSKAVRLQPNNTEFTRNLAMARELKAERDAKAAAPSPMRVPLPSSWDTLPVAPPVVVAPAPRVRP